MDIVVVDRTEPIEDDEVHNNGEVSIVLVYLCSIAMSH